MWFDDQAEEAARFYVAIFDDSRLLEMSRYGEAGQAMQAMLGMRKIDIAALRRAYED
ncbi:VOC family protein [Halomonas ramblicola]|uniref:VOC family protein n=1 Tax=Halomonas ramblicola TaxID=747349 RepID=UPI0025B37ACE|nr:VOC family protein [Halomonas ramblicola]MDN3520173.1 VOC family protein [Halomonas ramblicola]